MFVLGIDPGVSRCGYGCVEGRSGASARVVAVGVLTTPTSDALPARLAALDHDLRRLIAEYRPAAVAVERVFFQGNARTAMSVGQASGLALAVAARAGVPVCQYTPNEVKQAVAGYGAADKAQVQAMVARLLHLSEVPRPPDAADALALAICHLSAGRFRAAADVGGSGFTSAAPVAGLARAIAAASRRAGATGAAEPRRNGDLR
jgi:crossover junction endodeoxyribonuclease RuvC